MIPPCEQCRKTGETCLRKASGDGCLQCGQRKRGCSAVKLKRKRVAEVQRPRRGLMHDPQVGFTDRVMEQGEGMQKELRGIRESLEGIEAIMRIWLEREED